MAYVIPPNTRTTGSPAPAMDMDNTADMLGLLTRTVSQVITGSASADPAGNAANVTAVQGIVTAGTVLTSIPWLPADNGLLACSGDPVEFTSTVTVTGGTVYLAKLPIRQPMTISNLLFSLTTAGSGASTGTFAGLYTSAGSRVAVTADVATSFTGSTGTITCPLTVAYAATAGTFLWAAFVANLAVTQPTFQRTGGSSIGSNFNLAAASFRFATNGTLQTSLPSSITPGSNVTTANGLLVGAT